MTWTQETDPLHHIALSALVAIIPIVFLFWALVIKKMKGYIASLIALSLALLIAILVYKMPVDIALLSTLHGVMYGLFPICWIVVAAVFLFNITVKSGQFEVIKHFMASVTPDRRLQALIIAFSFGAFLEGTAGFGAPVAITAAMLVGLGFNPLYAAGICLIANTAPVAFGAIGTPAIVLAQVSGLPEMAISQMIGRTLPILSLLVPFYLVVLMSGFRKSMEVLPAILVTGGVFAVCQALSSNFLGPTLPDIISGVGSIIAMILFLKVWKPKNIWHFKDEVVAEQVVHYHYSGKEVFRAWSPFIVLTILMVAWGLAPVKAILDRWAVVSFEMPGLHNVILDHSGQPLMHIFKINYLSAAGTGIFISALVAMPMIGISLREGYKTFVATLKQLKFPIVTVGAVLGFAYIVNDSGITLSIAEALAATGFMFPFFSPILGWLGVFITGSDTSANALFGKLQSVTADTIGVDPVVTVSANASGGVVGKMISPQSIAVAAAAGGLVGKESDLFRFTVKHSFIMLFFICLLVLSQAYVFTWLMPSYTVSDTSKVNAPLTDGSGYAYLLGLIAILLAMLLFIKSGKKQNSVVRIRKA